MAISKDRKSSVISEIEALLSSSKLTVLANYPGTSVKAMQALRQTAGQNGTKVKVVKNRLFKLAISHDERFKQIDVGLFKGQLLYAFNAEDEVAPAQSLANFAKTEPQLQFVGALSSDGSFLPAEDVKILASLPTKEQLRGQLVGTVAAPLSGLVNVLSGNVRSLFNVLSARSTEIQ